MSLPGAIARERLAQLAQVATSPPLPRLTDEERLRLAGVLARAGWSPELADRLALCSAVDGPELRAEAQRALETVVGVLNTWLEVLAYLNGITGQEQEATSRERWHEHYRKGWADGVVFAGDVLGHALNTTALWALGHDRLPATMRVTMEHALGLAPTAPEVDRGDS